MGAVLLRSLHGVHQKDERLRMSFGTIPYQLYRTVGVLPLTQPVATFGKALFCLPLTSTFCEDYMYTGAAPFFCPLAAQISCTFSTTSVQFSSYGMVWHGIVWYGSALSNSLPGRRVPISSSTTFSSVQYTGTGPTPPPLPKKMCLSIV